jgi:hypothetical protein
MPPTETANTKPLEVGNRLKEMYCSTVPVTIKQYGNLLMNNSLFQKSIRKTSYKPQAAVITP